MTGHPPLSLELQRFIQEQIASGKFQSEEQVVLAALRLLAARPPQGSHTAFSTRQADRAPATSSGVSDSEQSNLMEAGSRRSPRGLLADLKSELGPEDFKEARSEVWIRLTGREAE